MRAKIKLFFLLAILFSGKIYAQNGLENLIVETYYVSDANDTNADQDGGVLPVGSVTYRLFVDMLPGYKFQAAYGVNTPGAAHELRISTSTMIWNNEDRGATSPTFSKTNAVKNTVMIDSWLSSGAACAGNFGIMKSLDDGMANAVNNYSPQVLQNNALQVGIPLTQQDGFLAVSGVNPESMTDVGISTEIVAFDNATVDSVFSTDNGSWASLNGSVGPDTIDNKVLIAQVTTDGVLCFQLNIQIGTPSGGVENYVAMNPVGPEILFPALNYCSNVGVTDHENFASAMLLVYPNPVKDIVKVKVNPAKQSKKNSYSITDITGKTLLTKDLGTGSASYLDVIDFSGFSQGVYFIQLNSGNTVTTKKIIKS